ncbi:MAG: right-handed parallel beta-helix repeat-containing protein, partial [Candidatus Hermodarchaeota archaeon]
MEKRSRFLIFTSILILLIGSNIMYLSLNNNLLMDNETTISNGDIGKTRFQEVDNYSDELENSAGAIVPEIYIDGDGSDPDAINWTEAVTLGICTGSGVFGDPYLIQNQIIADSDNSGGCIKIRDSMEYFTIQNCEFFNATLENYAAGISLINVKNGTIYNNDFFTNSYGIFLEGSCNNCTIKQNTIYDNNYGVYISGSSATNITLEQNTINNNDFGVFIGSSISITLNNNIFIACGLILSGSQNQISSHTISKSNTVNGNNLYYYVNNVSLKDNDFNNAGQVILVNCSQAKVSDVDTSYASRGISIYYSENNTISNSNSSYNFDYGIYIESSKNTTITGINVSFNIIDGISAYKSNELNISLNNLDFNGENGIYLSNCDNSNITNNNLIKNIESGIYIGSGSNNNNLTENTIIHGGIRIDGTKTDLASHFIDTTNTVNGDKIYYYVDQVNLKPNDFLDAGQIILISCNDSVIQNSNFTLLYRGITSYYCNNLTISNCNISSNIYGLYLYELKESVIKDNTANNNTENGIHLTNNCKFNNITENTACNNSQYGLYISGSISVSCELNNISGNTLNNNNERGMFLFYCDISLISNNSVINNQYCGMYISRSSNNNITKNNINLNSVGIFIQLGENNTVK